MPPEDAQRIRRNRFVVTDRTARRAVRSALVWSSVFAISVANSAYAYASTYPTLASRVKLAASFAGNAGFSALFGTPRRLQTVAGFTAWRTMGFLSILGAVWGLLLATRLTRGEEDAGRWELMISGATTRGHAAAQAAIGVGAGLLTLWIMTAAAALAIGSTSKVMFSTSASLFLATALIAGAAVFAAVGLLAAQLAGSRRQANAIGAAVLGASFLVRMVADSGSHLVWMRWVTPLGWLENLRPLTGSNPAPLAPIVVAVTFTVLVAVALASQRDLGGSVLPNRDEGTPSTALLDSVTGLAVRLGRNVDAAWIGGLGILGLILGLVAQSAAGAITASTTIERAIQRLGGHRSGAASYLGIAFLIAAALVAAAAAAQITSTRAEEAEGRLDHLLVRSVPRWRWLASRLLVAAAVVVTASLVTGVTSWAGAASQHSGISIGDLALAGLNIAPPGLFILGVGTLVLGVAPRLASGAAYGLVAWSLLIEMVASVTQSSRLLLDSSVLSHMTPAPAANPDWAAAAWMTGLGLVAAVLGAVAFSHRDMVTA